MDIDDEFVDEAGAVIRRHNTIVADGAEPPTPNGFVVTATWRGAKRSTPWRRRTARWSAAGRYTVSADGRHLTIVANGAIRSSCSIAPPWSRSRVTA